MRTLCGYYHDILYISAHEQKPVFSVKYQLKVLGGKKWEKQYFISGEGVPSEWLLE